jgi:hypothetical protein
VSHFGYRSRCFSASPEDFSQPPAPDQH